MSTPLDIRHGLETPHPFRPAQGYFRLEGWALVPGAKAPTRTRLRVGETVFAPETTFDRPDVAAEFADDPHALHSGFRFLCYLPFGLHLGALEVSIDDLTWENVRVLSIPVSSHPLLGAFEKPPPGSFIDHALRVEGWCFHPEFELESVALRFGNLQAACDHGLERLDVAGLFPQHEAAKHAGFITSENLPRGSGKLRLHVETRCGRTYFLDSDLQGDIRIGTDATRSPLSAVRTPLTVPPAAHERVSSDAVERMLPPPGPRNILFALYGDFTCNSALHVAALANELIDRGYDCVVAGPSHKETIVALPRARFMALEFDELGDLPDYFVDHRGPSLIHVWTPREVVRRFTERVRALYAVPVFVHLEDSERAILESRVGRSTAELLQLPESELDGLVPNDLSHPRHAQEFLHSAAGVTTIVEKLSEDVPPSVPTMTFWPAADPNLYCAKEANRALRTALGIRLEDTVLVYHGNAHPANVAEVGSLYQAVTLLNQRGHRTFLIRAGRDDGDLMAEENARIGSHLLHLGYTAPRFLPDVMRLADYFVQPGVPGAFNDYRFPSKLPEFFAIGRPVILPRSNLGAAVKHGEDAYVLPRADAESIAAAVLELNADPALVAQLTQGALAFAEQHFSWKRCAERLLEFYLAHSALARAETPA